jgi:hypothetical protein
MATALRAAVSIGRLVSKRKRRKLRRRSWKIKAKAAVR